MESQSPVRHTERVRGDSSRESVQHCSGRRQAGLHGNVQATYTGNGTDTSQSVLTALTFKALGPSNVTYDYSDDCGVIPNELPSSKDVFKGGSVTGNICWVVTNAYAKALLQDVEPEFSVKTAPVFFALT